MREPDAESLRRLYAGAGIRPETPEPDLASDEPVRFVADKDRQVTTTHPLSKAAFLVLGAIWPRWLAVPDLLAAARARVSAAGGRLATAEDETRLLGFLLRSYGANVTQLRSMACPFVTEISERPRASALARLQSRTLTEVTNLRHQSVRLEDSLVRRFLQLLDGTRDRTAIGREMAAALREEVHATAAPDVEKRIASTFDRVGQLGLLEA